MFFYCKNLTQIFRFLDSCHAEIVWMQWLLHSHIFYRQVKSLKILIHVGNCPNVLVFVFYALGHFFSKINYKRLCVRASSEKFTSKIGLSENQ